MSTATKTKRKTAKRPTFGVKKSQAKWCRNEHDEKAVAKGCTFDERAAMLVVEFFARFLRHSKSPWNGRPFEVLDWERDNVIYPVFGWKRPDGYRRIRRCDIWVAKKNGKSTLGAGLGLYLLASDGEAGAEIYSAATKREQAAQVHSEAINMVHSSKQLMKHLKINESSHVISHTASMSKYATLSAEAKGAEGINAHGLIIDELHAWTNRAFWNALRYAMRGRRQPLAFVLSTAGIYDVQSIGYQEYAYAKKWLAGTVDNERYHTFIAEADPKDVDDLDNPEVYRKANPSYGTTIDPDDMQAEAKLAIDQPNERNNFLRYCLNIWVESANPWIDLAKWDACRKEFTEADLAGRTCFGGLDLAAKRDIAAFVLLFPPSNKNESKWWILPRFWAPRGNVVELEQKHGVKYLEWEKRGWMTLTPGERIDYEVVRRQIEADRRQFDLREIGADPWNLEYMRQRLDPDAEFIIEYGQNMQNMSPPFKELDCLIAESALAQDGNEALRWMVGNVTTIEDSNENIRPCKKKSTGKIDGIVAIIMALGRAMTAKEETGGPSIMVLQ